MKTNEELFDELNLSINFLTQALILGMIKEAMKLTVHIFKLVTLLEENYDNS